MDTEMNKNNNLPFRKENPNVIAGFLFKKRGTLKGIYYLQDIGF